MLRGRSGTESAAGTHSAGEQFALIQGDALRPVELPDWAVGSEVAAALVGPAAAAAMIIATGESLRPPSPVRLEAAFTAAGDLALSWIRRSRRGWAWADEKDAPLGESREAYRIVIMGPAGSIELDAETPAITIAAAELAIVGAGAASVEVRQIGDWAVSRPGRRTINIA